MSLTNKELRILNNHREILWLRREIEEFEKEDKIKSECEDDSIPDTATSEHVEERLEQYKTTIDETKAHLEVVYEFNRSKDLLTSAVNNHHIALDALYPQSSDQLETKLILEEKINKRDELIVQFMHILKQLNKKKSELTQIQRRIGKQHEQNKLVTTQINELREINATQENQEPVSAELLKKVNDMKHQMATLRGVLNGIILESGIQWENDERWLNAMLRIGEPL